MIHVCCHGDIILMMRCHCSTILLMEMYMYFISVHVNVYAYVHVHALCTCTFGHVDHLPFILSFIFICVGLLLCF